MPFDQIPRTNLSGQVVKAVRRQILSGELKPGERVVEAEIARALGISRAPVREAFVELDREGLIATYPRKGTYVNRFTEKDVEEIYALRALLEGYAAARACLNPEDLKRLRKIIAQMCISENPNFVELHAQFHEEICKFADHRRFYSCWKSLLAQTRMLSSVAAEPERIRNLREIGKDHKALVEALLRGDKARIKETFERHILNAMDRLIGYLRKMREGDARKEKTHQPSSAPSLEDRRRQKGK